MKAPVKLWRPSDALSDWSNSKVGNLEQATGRKPTTYVDRIK